MKSLIMPVLISALVYMALTTPLNFNVIYSRFGDLTLPLIAFIALLVMVSFWIRSKV